VGAFFVPAIVHLEDNHKDTLVEETLAADAVPV
jgi:hypothetical protein